LKAAIAQYDGEPQIWQKEGRLVRVKFNDSRASLDYFTPDILAVTLNEYADFFRQYRGKEGVSLRPN
jgi:hypothetical protein